jgi:hypothetical protein
VSHCGKQENFERVLKEIKGSDAVNLKKLEKDLKNVKKSQ